MRYQKLRNVIATSLENVRLLFHFTDKNFNFPKNWIMYHAIDRKLANRLFKLNQFPSKFYQE